MTPKPRPLLTAHPEPPEPDKHEVNFRDRQTGAIVRAVAWRHSFGADLRPRVSAVVVQPPAIILAPIADTLLVGAGVIVQARAAARAVSLLEQIEAAATTGAAPADMAARVAAMLPAIRQCLAQSKENPTP